MHSDVPVTETVSDSIPWLALVKLCSVLLHKGHLTWKTCFSYPHGFCFGDQAHHGINKSKIRLAKQKAEAVLVLNNATYNTHGPLSGTTRVGRYQKKHSPTHTHPVRQTSFINFLHLLRSIASSLFNLRTLQSFSTTSVKVLFGLPLGLGPSTSYSMHFFTQSSFRNTCPYHHSLFCCNTNVMSSTSSLSLSSLLGLYWIL